MAKIDVSEDQLRILIAAAITEAFGPEQRSELVTQAITQVLHKDNAYRIKNAFDEAMKKLAVEMATKVLTDDPTFTRRLKELLMEGVEAFFVTNREENIKRIADGLTRSFRGF